MAFDARLSRRGPGMIRIVTPRHLGRSSLIVAALVGMALIACSGPSPAGSTDAEAASQAATAEPVASPGDTEPPASAAPEAATCPTADESCQIVPASANIFGAGHDEPPAPGEGGAGTLPPMWAVPAGATTMAVTGTAGTVKPVPASGGSGASGESGWATDVSSHNGISGIVHRTKGLFLVGVFLTDETPLEGEHPERLGFTDNEDFAELAPEIAQTFFIGDGVGHTVIVPSGATRLFLGFADANQFQGDPGYYGNNSGQLTVSVEFAID